MLIGYMWQTNMFLFDTIYFTVRSLDYFYKLFLIDSKERTSIQLCSFVKSGKMHNAFQKYLRPDKMGIDYSHLKDFDTWAALEPAFSDQRPAVEKALRDAVAARQAGRLDEAISSATRIGIQRSNPKLFAVAKALRKQL
jgi:hypothetical protein